MKATEIRTNKTLMNILNTLASGRTVKTHNHEGFYTIKPVSIWDKNSLSEVYKRPSATKIAIDEEIRRDVYGMDGIKVIDKWFYSGNCMSFSMSTTIEHEGKRYSITFTRDNLHVHGFDDYHVNI